MKHQYLYPRQRAIEVYSAFYIGGLGSYSAFCDAVSIRSPISWIVHGEPAQLALAIVMMATCLIWALGININGSRWWSPFLRAAAMTVSLSVGIFATWQGAGSSATYTYGWISAFLATGMVNAVRDCASSWKGQEAWMI